MTSLMHEHAAGFQNHVSAGQLALPSAIAGGALDATECFASAQNAHLRRIRRGVGPDVREHEMITDLYLPLKG